MISATRVLPVLRWPSPAAAISLMLAIGGAISVVVADEQEQPPRYSKPVLIGFEGEIGPMMQQYVIRKLDEAQRDGADLLIVEIDSPGGTVDDSFQIAERLRDIDWAHTVAYIPREAISGGAFVALGCDDIIMAPNAALGDAGPIFREEGAIFFEHVPEKIRSYIERRVRDLAEAKGRPRALAEAMVDNKLVVRRVRNDQGEIRFMSDAERKDAQNAVPRVEWELMGDVLETTDDDFMTVNGVRAVELQLAQGNASSREDLLARYDVSGELKVLEWTGVDTAVLVLNNPFVTGLLFVVGLIALYVEFSAPGISVGGVIAGLCFALFFWSRFLGGTSGWLEVVLFVVGLIFLGVEIFLLPGFGVFGLTGVLLLMVSLVMASQSFALPDTQFQMNTLLMNLLVVAGSMVAVIMTTIILSNYFGTIPIVNQLALQPPAIDESVAAQVSGQGPGVSVIEPRSAALAAIPLEIGDCGVADSPLRPAGKASFGDEPYDVVTEGTFVEGGTPVRIIKMRANQIVVRPVE